MIKRKLEKFFRSEAGILLVLILLISAVFGLINPSYFTPVNTINMIRTSIDNCIMALGVLLVMISGGIDISFMAIGSFSMYATVKFCVTYLFDAPLPLIFLISAGIGLFFGLCNAFFVSKMSLPAFIVTLGTQSVIKGSLILFLGTSYIVDIPKSMSGASKTYLLTAVSPDGSATGLSVIVLILVALYILIAFLLRYTRIGRDIYAVGGDIIAAKRAGVNVTGTLFFIYAMAGIISGIGGVVHASLFRTAVPGDMIGNELFVIAAVILGGAQAEKGKGTIIGTLLGVMLITIISNNLLLLKIPTYFQQAVLGVIIILGTMLQSRRRNAEAAS